MNMRMENILKNSKIFDREWKSDKIDGKEYGTIKMEQNMKDYLKAGKRKEKGLNIMMMGQIMIVNGKMN